MKQTSLAIAAAVAIAASAYAETFSVPINPSNSQVTVTLTLIGVSDTDTSPVTGSVNLKLDTVANAMQVTGNDFTLALTNDLTLNISFGFLGAFNSQLNDLVILYANPGTPFGPVPISNGMFSLLGVPANTDGVLTYNATGLVCSQLQSAGLPCNDVDDLSTEPTQNIDFNSNISISGRTVTVGATIDRTAPVDPANPSLGTIRVVGTITGSAVVPLFLGDANGDCLVNFSDFATILANFGGSGPDGDSNSSGSVDFSDVAATLANFGASCL